MEVIKIVALKLLRLPFVLSLRALRLVLDSATSCVGQIVYGSQKDALPLIEDNILLLPALELARRIREKEVKCEDVIKAYIQRIHAVNPMINAVVDERYSEALKEAKAVDELVQNYQESLQSLATKKPFLGVPFSIKNTFSAKGFAWDAGNPLRANIKSEHDSTLVTRMYEAGAILIVMTNVPELCLWYNSHNYIYGETKNPYDLSRIPGGSSGGEAALISSGASVIGVGNDIAGSLRFPAVFCGIFSHKSSSEIILCDYLYPTLLPEVKRFMCAGPLCRFSTDLRPMMKVLVGEEMAAQLELDKRIDFSQTKFYYVMELQNPFATPVQPEIKGAMEKVIAHFKVFHGAQVEAVSLPSLDNALLIWTAAMKTIDMPTLTEVLSDENSKVHVSHELLLWLLGRPRHTLHILLFALLEKVSPKKTSPIYAYILKDLQILSKQFDDLFSSATNVVFLIPTYPEVAPFRNETISKCINSTYVTAFSLLGLPVTQCPTGTGKDDLPIGIQVVSAKNRDHVTISVAEEIEGLFGGWRNPNCSVRKSSKLA